MQPRRRRPPPPWERRHAEQRHPIGHARRRWPRAYDGGEPTPPRLNPRYRRAFDGGMPAGERGRSGTTTHRRRGSTFDRIRRNPIRHGLIGLSIAGAAAPVAMARYQRVVRHAPGHEQTLAQSPMQRLTDEAVSQAWAEARVNAAPEAQTAAVSGEDAERESTIQEKLAKYQEFGLDRNLADRIYDLALENDLDPDMAFGLVRTESEFKNTAKSHVGARGLTQLMPATARVMRPGTTASDLEDPEVNLSIGFRYLHELIDKYQGDKRLALLAYNRGPGTVDRVLKRGGDPDNGYADAVLNR